MKIICSKHQRDYYDYLVSYYGYDDHIVYDRRNSGIVSIKWPNRFLFYICGEIFPVIKKGGTFITDPKDPSLTNGYDVGARQRSFDRSWMEKWYRRPTSVNAEMRQPVLCSSDDFSLAEKNYFIPRLADFGFASKIDAHEMYQKVYAFLSWLKDNPAIADNQTDVDKTVAHGFDLKTSFRPKMKI